jgi:hypothetical protein
VAESDQRGDGDDRHRRSDLPRVVVPPEDQRGCRARRRGAVMSREPRARRPRQSTDGRFTDMADEGSWGRSEDFRSLRVRRNMTVVPAGR